MQRGGEAMGGGLGPQLAGEKLSVNRRVVTVVKQLGEGGFSFVYLVKDMSENSSNTAAHDNSNSSSNPSQSRSGGSNTASNGPGGGPAGSGKGEASHLVLKITSIHSRQQRDIAEKEAKLLSRLSHPSIVRMMDTCYRTLPSSGSGGNGPLSGIVGNRGGHNNNSNNNNDHHHNNPSSPNGSSGGVGGRPQHLILMEYCEGGTALSVCTNLRASNQRFDLPALIIAFGQICNAVSYLHAQRPPIVHRDLKPVNFLVKNGAYKLCDFGSAVFGHVDLRTARARQEAEEVIQKTTTQMFRSPEMVDLYMSKKLTQSTDVWALGCCLFSIAFFQNCFEEGSNLAILSRNFKIPEDNPYGDGLIELIDRMLTVDNKARADMTEVILCLSAIYSGRPLPPRKRAEKAKAKELLDGDGPKEDRVGTFRTDGQGIRKSVVEPKKPAEAKKLNPNSAAARRRRAARTTADAPGSGPVILAAPESSFATVSAPTSPVPILTREFEASFSDLFMFKGKKDLADPFQVSNADENNTTNDPLSFECFHSDNAALNDCGESIPFASDVDDFTSFGTAGSNWAGSQADTASGTGSIGDDGFGTTYVDFQNDEGIATKGKSRGRRTQSVEKYEIDPVTTASEAESGATTPSEIDEEKCSGRHGSHRRARSLDEINVALTNDSPDSKPSGANGEAKKKKRSGIKSLFRKQEKHVDA